MYVTLEHVSLHVKYMKIKIILILNTDEYGNDTEALGKLFLLQFYLYLINVIYIF